MAFHGPPANHCGMIAFMTVYACPICASELSDIGQVFRCAKNHTFDIAKEGYVNLLPANQKRSLAPGDSAAMISARRRFLGAGHYQKLANRLVEIIGYPKRLVDLGCGEGYFTAAFCQVAAEVWGLDISKVAVKAACKQSSANFVVASTMRLPYLAEIFDAATVIMAPMSADISRVLKRKGILCRVLPGAQHFVELRELAYRELRGHRTPPTKLDGFVHITCERVTFEIALQQDELVDLIAMTPMQFKTSKDFRQQISQLEVLRVTADFQIDLFCKN